MYGRDCLRTFGTTHVYVKTRTQNEWSLTNQIGYTGFDKILIFNIFVDYFYHKGPALSQRTRTPVYNTITVG